MKRTKPRQHVRRLKNGKKILVNRGVKPKIRRARSIKDSDKLVAYHGTSSDQLPRIMKEGLLPAKTTGNQNMVLDMRGRPNALDKVSVTTRPTYAKFYAEISSKAQKSDPVVLSVNVPKKKGEEHVAWYPGQDEYMVDNVPPEKIKVLAKGERELKRLNERRFVRDWNKNLPKDDYRRVKKDPSWVDDEISMGMKMLNRGGFNDEK